MSFDDRVAAVGIATQFQERSKEVYKMVEEETEFAKTQVVIKRIAICLRTRLFLTLERERLPKSKSSKENEDSREHFRKLEY